MGDLAFGKDFGMLSSGEEHFAVQLLNEGMQPMANFRTWTLLPEKARLTTPSSGVALPRLDRHPWASSWLS